MEIHEWTLWKFRDLGAHHGFSPGFEKIEIKSIFIITFRHVSVPLPNSKANSVLNQSKIQKLSVLIQTLIQVTFSSEFL